MNRREVFLPIVAGVVAGVGLFPYAAVEPVEPVTAPVMETFPPALPLSPLPNEDDPDWDCRTMGNLTCGPSTAASKWSGKADNVIGNTNSGDKPTLRSVEISPHGDNGGTWDVARQTVHGLSYMLRKEDDI